MTENSTTSKLAAELTQTAPIEEPSSIIKADGDRIVVIVEGRAAPRLHSSMVTGFIIFLASAFICPGIGLMAVVLLPVALLVLVVIFAIRPDILKRPENTQALVIADDQIRIYEGCPRTFDVSDDDDESLIPAVVMPREAVKKVAIRPPDDKKDLAAAIEVFDEKGLHFELAAGLVDAEEDYDGWAELEWLSGLLEGWLLSPR